MHDMTHLWNVIGLMEELIPPEVWESPWKQPSDPLGPFQCLLCVMAGQVHDIGMAPPQALIDKLQEAEALSHATPADADKDFVAYRRHFASCEDDVRAIAALLEKSGTSLVENDEITRRRQMIRTEYLRLTHSDDTIGGCSLIRTWLATRQPSVMDKPFPIRLPGSGSSDSSSFRLRLCLERNFPEAPLPVASEGAELPGSAVPG